MGAARFAGKAAAVLLVLLLVVLLGLGIAAARLPRVGHIPHIEDKPGFLAALDSALVPDRERERT